MLKNLTVPGLDVRLAFGRVKDEVMKSTDNRQEPFVYGSLGGGNVALVPAPAVPQETPASDVKADYELVQKIGTRRAWEVFLGTHPTGFYADLARAQIEALNRRRRRVEHPLRPAAGVPEPGDTDQGGAGMGQGQGLRRSGGIAALHQALSGLAALDQRPAAHRPLEEGRAGTRGTGARRARGDAQGRRGGATSGRAAQGRAGGGKEREEDSARTTSAAPGRRKRQQKARAAEAERRAAEAKAKSEQAERDRAAAEAAAQRAAAEKQAKAVEAEQKAKAAEAERKATEERRKAEQEAAAAKAASERQAREAEEARKKAELAAAKEAACKAEQTRLEAITAKGSEGSGLEDLKAFTKSLSCERLGGPVAATLDKFKAEAASRAAKLPNSPELVRSAQTQLVRLGCLTGKVDGALNAPTSAALGRYMKIEGQPSDHVSVTEAGGRIDQAHQPRLPDRVQGRGDAERRDLRRR